MMRVDDSIISLFHSTLVSGTKRDNDVVEIPDSEIERGPLSEGETYRVAILGSVEETNNSKKSVAPQDEQAAVESLTADEEPSYPVEEGQQVEVAIEDIGKEGDGIAKVDGYAIIVPDAEIGEDLLVEINHTTESHAFATAIGPQLTHSD